MNRLTTVLSALLLIGAVGCVDLDVQNPNAPDQARAISTPGDVEALIAGAYAQWLATQYYNGPTMFLSSIAAEHVAPWGNAAMHQYSQIPRIPTQNAAGAPNVINLTYAWSQSYKAISSLRSGLKSIADGTVDLDVLGPDRNLRAQAYGKYMQGLAHATVAVLYDSGFVYDETIDAAAVVLEPYGTVMEHALAYFAEAAALAHGATFTIPAEWMSVDVPAATLEQLAYAQAARYRAAVARTPDERAAVDWAAVRSDVAKAITTDWIMEMDCNLFVFCEEALGYRMYEGWQMQNNWVAGMADTSGAYQTWIGTPTASKRPFILHTPDTRWPAGATEAEQLANPGDYYHMNQGSDGTRIWNRPDRGTWRWSYYIQRYEPYFNVENNIGAGSIPQVTVREMKALVAEADFRSGALGAVATFVNETRTAHGLLATDAGGTNTNCVPKLPNGSCGNLLEMFKWEKRLETQFAGPARIGWYFDGRGWGDLHEGSMLQLPVPYTDYQLLGRVPYNFGGSGLGLASWAAPVGTYGY